MSLGLKEDNHLNKVICLSGCLLSIVVKFNANVFCVFFVLFCVS